MRRLGGSSFSLASAFLSAFLFLGSSMVGEAGNYGLNVSGFPPDTDVTVHFTHVINFFHNYNGDCGSVPTSEGLGNSGTHTFHTDSTGHYSIAPSSDKDVSFAESSETMTGSDGGVNWTITTGSVGCGTTLQNTHTIEGDYHGACTVVFRYTGTAQCVHTIAITTGRDSGTEDFGPAGGPAEVVNGTMTLDGEVGDSWSASVDGHVVGGGHLTLNPETGCPYSPLINFGTVGCSTPAPTPTPTPSATPSPHVTPTPFPTPDPTPSNPPGTTPFPTTGATPATITAGNGQNGMGVVILNPDDIYKPIVDSQKATGTIPTPDTNLDNADLSDEGQIQAATDMTQNMADLGTGHLQAVESTVNTGKTKILALLDQIAAVGSVHTIDATVPSAGGLWSAYTFHIDLSTWATGIEVFRLFVLITAIIAYGFLTLRALTYQS